MYNECSGCVIKLITNELLCVNLGWARVDIYGQF